MYSPLLSSSFARVQRFQRETALKVMKWQYQCRSKGHIGSMPSIYNFVTSRIHTTTLRFCYQEMDNVAQETTRLQPLHSCELAHIKETFPQLGMGISLVKPDKAKPKGRNKDANEKELKLGTKGVKNKSRKCKTCGISDGHNASTCLQVPANRERLANLASEREVGRRAPKTVRVPLSRGRT